MQLRKMGVINITPDSFSDGNQFNSLDSFTEKFEKILEWADVVDIGAESTAPFNNAISIEEETSRFEETLFPFLKSHEDPEIYLSIDTYKTEVMEFVCQKVNHYWPKTKLVFNDVSGKIDDKLIEFLRTYPQVTYVYSHNLCPTREETINHMDFCKEIPRTKFLAEIVDYFSAGLERLGLVSNAIWIDPCFGFSKTREQNHFLLARFKTFLLQVPFDIPCVVGLSRKSFLRFPADLDIKSKTGLVSVEQIHSNLLFYLLRSQFQRDLIVRTHSATPIESALNSLNIFEV